MSAIKNFFKQRKLDAKFKLAGEGHKLTDDTRARASGSLPSPSTSMTKTQMTDEKKMAADAALARLNQAKATSKPPGSSVRAQVKQEVLTEQKARQQAAAEAARYTGPKEMDIEVHPAANSVLFHCPMIGLEVLPKDKMEARIEEFLLSQLEEEPVMTSALVIHTLNKNSEQVKQCTEIIQKYLDNIIDHPGEEKYQRIRSGNKVLKEKVLSLRGSLEFLLAAGFEPKVAEGPDGSSDEFFVMPAEKANNIDHLRSLKEILSVAEPVRPELDRGIRVFHPSQTASRITVPDEFFAISAEEMKKEMQIRKEAVEKFGMLQTKEMRERDRIRELRRYRYCLIRIRFPDGVLLQGTFRANEKLAALQEFVVACLATDWIPFFLSNHLGSKLDSEGLTLAELDLAPASLIQFAYDPNVVAEIAAQNGSVAFSSYLKPELMAQITSL